MGNAIFSTILRILGRTFIDFQPSSTVAANATDFANTVAIVAVKNACTLAELPKRLTVHTNQSQKWEKELATKAESI